MTKRRLLPIVIVIVIIGGVAYRQHQSSTITKPQSDKLHISTSFYPLYFFASQVAGNNATIYNITPAAAEPHDYEPTTQDIARVEDGRILILQGGIEAWGKKIQATLKGTSVAVITAGQGLLTQQVTEDGNTIVDPHIWLDPILAKQEVAVITQGFISIDPAHAADYQVNQRTLNGQLDQLDQEYRSGLANCQKKDIITSHAAFGYLASRYGLYQVPITGLSPDAEPSAQQLVDITAFAKKHQVQYIFFESLVSPKLAQTIATEVGAKTLVLDPIEGVTPDEAKAGRDYYSIMMDNLKNLQTALQCS